MPERYPPQVLHVVHHVDQHLAHLFLKLIQAIQPAKGGITQAQIDEFTQRLKAGNDSLETKLTPPD